MHRRLRRVRLVTLIALATNATGALLLPAIGLWREPSPVRVALGVLGIVLFFAAQAAVLYAVLTPWVGDRNRRRATVFFAAAAVASLPLVGPMGGTWPSWSWMAACIVGVLPVLTGWLRAALLGAATVAVAALTTPGSVRDSLIISAGFGLGVAAVNVLLVWLWDLLLQAENGRAAQARLAAAEERLRFARDVHDLLGHNLSVIALKAELAERLATVDSDRAGREAAEIRRLATSALAEVREVVHGYRQVDLAEQLTAIEQILRSSGVRCTVTAPGDDLPSAGVLSAVLREATTNVLRHSTATWCTIAITGGRADGEIRMTVTNDGASPTAVPDPHSHGLRGLADRVSEAGGVLRTEAADGRFTVEAVVPSTP
jgi:two-component system, NarL family, sensor histidine kinase DesK